MLVICLLHRIDIAYSRTKSDDFRFSRSSDIIGAPKFCNGSHDLTTIFYDSSVATICLDLAPFPRYDHLFPKTQKGHVTMNISLSGVIHHAYIITFVYQSAHEITSA